MDDTNLPQTPDRFCYRSRISPHRDRQERGSPEPELPATTSHAKVVDHAHNTGAWRITLLRREDMDLLGCGSDGPPSQV